MSKTAKPYKETLNLPATRFEMKANLHGREPEIQARWREQDIYGQVRRARAGAPRKVLHDGPPYANGEIHMGTALNKMLKDFVVRSLTMRGFDSPYVPGWDCHGLPIEHKVVKDLGSKRGDDQPRRDPGPLPRRGDEVGRRPAPASSAGWAFWATGINPYLTLDPRYEAGILDVLADLLELGLRLPPAQADSLVHVRPHGPGRGRARIPRGDHAQHLRQLSDGLGRARGLDESDGSSDATGMR